MSLTAALLRSIDLGVNTISGRMDAVQAVPTQKFEGSTDEGFSRNLRYISSTNHSFCPNGEGELDKSHPRSLR